MRAGPGADVIEPGPGCSGPAPGAADRPVPRAAGRGGGGPVDGGDAGDSAFVAGASGDGRRRAGRGPGGAGSVVAQDGQDAQELDVEPHDGHDQAEGALGKLIPYYLLAIFSTFFSLALAVGLFGVSSSL